mmetsp:Transcript_5351/g.13519  ORF Transcript_5351/g.13519 Transcript_5351/m.13519 type:complete len:855 (+) Transcript_5351:307-2871(+)
MAARQLISQKAPLHSDAEVTISVAPGAAAVAGEAKRNPTMNRRQARAAADHQSTPPRQLKEKDRGGAGSHSGSSGAESQTQNSLVAPRSAKRDNNLHPLTQRTRPSDVAAAAGEREPTVLAHSPSPSKPGTTGSARKAGGGDRERPSSRAQNDQESRSRFAPRDEGKRVFSSGFAPRPGVEGTGSTSSGGNAGSAGGRESSSHATKDGEGAKLMKRFNKNVELGTGKAGIAGQLPTGDQRGGKTTSNAGSATGLDQTKSGVRASSSQGGRRRGLKKEDDPPQYIQSEPEHSSKDASESADVSEQSPSIGSNVTYTGVRIPPTNLSFHQPLVQQQYLQQHRDRVGQTPPSATTPAGQMQIPAGYTPYTAGSPMFAYSPISASAQSPFGLMSRQFGAVGVPGGAAQAQAQAHAQAEAQAQALASAAGRPPVLPGAHQGSGSGTPASASGVAPVGATLAGAGGQVAQAAAAEPEVNDEDSCQSVPQEANRLAAPALRMPQLTKTRLQTQAAAALRSRSSGIGRTTSSSTSSTGGRQVTTPLVSASGALLEEAMAQPQPVRGRAGFRPPLPTEHPAAAAPAAATGSGGGLTQQPGLTQQRATSNFSRAATPTAGSNSTGMTQQFQPPPRSVTSGTASAAATAAGATPTSMQQASPFFRAPAGASGQGGFPQAISQQGAPQEQGATLQTHTMSMGQQLDNIPDLVCIDFDDCLACAHLYRDNPSPAEWAKSNFGSAERVDYIKFHLRKIKLTKKSTLVCVLTLNQTGPVSEALSAVGLLECFDKVFGSDVPPFESSKAQRMERMLRDVRMMHPDAAGTAVLIDDSVGNCRDAAMAGFSTICQRHITCEALIRVLNGQYD